MSDRSEVRIEGVGDAVEAREVVVCVRADGSLDFLYDEGVGIERLGGRRARRASHVEMSEETGDWEARCAETGELIFRDPSRARCIEEERRYFNRKLAGGLDPFSED